MQVCVCYVRLCIGAEGVHARLWLFPTALNASCLGSTVLHPTQVTEPQLLSATKSHVMHMCACASSLCVCFLCLWGCKLCVCVLLPQHRTLHNVH